MTRPIVAGALLVLLTTEVGAQSGVAPVGSLHELRLDLGSRDSAVHKRAMRRIARLGTAAAALAPDLAARIEAIEAQEALVALGTTAVPSLTRLLEGAPKTYGDERDQYHAAWVLERIGPAARGAVPALLRATRRSDYVREQALRALVAIGGDPPRTRAALAAALGAAHVGVRFTAYELLGRTREGRRLRRVWRDHALKGPFPSLDRSTAALTAAREGLDTPPTRAGLRDALRMPVPHYFQNSVLRLLADRGRGARWALPLLLDLLDDNPQNPTTLCRAVSLIAPGTKLEGRALKRLTRLLAHVHPIVREAARRAIVRFPLTLLGVPLEDD